MRNKHLSFIVAILFTLGIVGCSTTQTVVPQNVKPVVASHDSTTPPQYGDGWNSGLLDILPNGDRVVSPLYVTRYDFLVSCYGKAMTPPVTEHWGVKPYVDKWGNNLFKVTPEVVSVFIMMNIKLKNGDAPVQKTWTEELLQVKDRLFGTDKKEDGKNSVTP